MGPGVMCTSCGAENVPGAKFCVECGTSLAMRCASCGTAYQAGQKFCAECGAPVGAASAAGPVAAAAESASERRFVSVLFVDLVGFTALSEGREAEDVRELLGSYFSAARTVVERYGGAIEKFIGDAVMAVWGSSAAREDDAERAVRAALEIAEAVAAFGESMGAPGLRARAGVVTGQVAAVANPGEGIVVGDRVNTASRVQSLAEPGTVLVDEITRQITSAAIAYEDAGEHTVKGKTEPLRLWRAVRVVAGAGGRDRAESLEAPFLGRDSELRVLKEMLHATVERGSSRLVAITGEAGVGKSRMRDELLHYVDGLVDTFLYHAGRCLAHGEGVAYWALAEMVRQRLGIPEEASNDDAIRKLEAGLVEWVDDPDDRAFIGPRLGALIGVAEPGLAREDLLAGWRLFFERLAAHEPVVMVFEDMQWADAGLLEFIDQLLDWSTSVPILIVTLARPELAERRDGWPAGRRGATLLPLEPLSESTVRELLGAMVDGLSDDAVDRIVGQAQGVPLYVIETIRALADRGVLAEREGRFVVTGELGELHVPASLSALLAARLDALGADERALVKAMSVYGGSFPREAARVLGALPDDRLDLALAGLVRKHVLIIRADRLSPERGQYAFAQGLLRSAAYELLARRERKQRHLAAATHLRSAFADDGEDVAEVIAAHLLDAHRAAVGDDDAESLRAEAVAALRRAGARAEKVGAPDAAERSYRTAAELAGAPDRPELLDLAGRMAIQAGRADAGLELLEQASVEYAASGCDREAALIALPVADALVRVARPGEAVERLRFALGVLDDGDDALNADVGRLQAMLSRAAAFLGDRATALPAIESALEIAQALELPDVLAEALTNRGMFCMFANRAQEARFLLAAAIEVAEEHELLGQLARAQGISGSVGLIYDLPGTRGLIEAGLATVRRRGDRLNESLGSGNLMLVDLNEGRWAAAEEIAVTLLDADPGRPGAEALHARLLELHMLRGNADAAASAFAELADWAESDDIDFAVSYDTAVFRAGLAAGEREEALARALRDFARTSEIERLRETWPEALDVALESGRLDAAHDLLTVLGERPPGHIPPYLRAEFERGRALVAAAEDRDQDVEALLRHAMAQLQDLGFAYRSAVVQADLAGWLIDTGRATEAGPLLDEAISVFESLGATPALGRARRIAVAPGDPAQLTPPR